MAADRREGGYVEDGLDARMPTNEDRTDDHHDDVSEALSNALERERLRRAAELREHLDEIRLLRAWLRLDLTSDVAARLSDDLADVQGQLTDLLLGWQDMGGVVALATDSPMLVALPAFGEDDLPDEASPTFEDGRDATDELSTAAEAVVDDLVEPSSPTADVEVQPEPQSASDGLPAGDAVPPSMLVEAPTVAASRPPNKAAPTSPSRLASSAQLSALQRHFTLGPSPTDIPAEGWHSKLDRVLADLVPASDLDAEEQRVCAAVSRTDNWSAFPKSVQRLLVGLVASRLRSLQDDHERGSRTINTAFSRLTAFSAREQPGFVFGLARDHKPQHGTWSEDADRYWDELADLLPADDPDEPTVGELLHGVEEVVPEISTAPQEMRPTLRRQAVRRIRAALEGGVRSRNTRLVNLAAPLLDDLDGREFRSLRRAIRERGDEVGDDEDDNNPIPDDWAWWGRTRGRRALLVGGDPREPNRQRLQEIFGFDSLEWLATTGKPQSLQSIASRIRRGSVDLLIILTRFVGHNYDDILLPACKDAGVDWVSVDHGYGSARIRQAIERFLDAES